MYYIILYIILYYIILYYIILYYLILYIYDSEITVASAPFLQVALTSLAGLKRLGSHHDVFSVMEIKARIAKSWKKQSFPPLARKGGGWGGGRRS